MVIRTVPGEIQRKLHLPGQVPASPMQRVAMEKYRVTRLQFDVNSCVDERPVLRDILTEKQSLIEASSIQVHTVRTRNKLDCTVGGPFGTQGQPCRDQVITFEDQ